MKNKILTVTIIGALVASSLTSFGQEDKKAAQARKDVKEANKDLREAKIDSAADFQKFKKESEMSILENQKTIAELKAKKLSDNKEENEKYNKKVSALENRNTELKKRIDTADNTKTSMWSSFKREFSHDLSELGHAFKDIGVNNTK